MKWFTTAVIISQLSLHQSTGQDIFECNICGDGKQVHNASGIISIPPSTEDNCAELEFLGSRGSIDETTCALLQPLAQIPCDCRDVDIPATNDTEAPTSTPTELPTFGPPPDCYSDLNEILERDWLFTEDEVEYIPRTYTICPDTVYQMGVITSSGHGVEYTGGFDALVPRPNSHYKCGESGLLSNNCVLTGGSWPIIGYGGDLQMLNVTFEGFVIESAVEGGVILSKPGDITFIDCVFRNHQNLGVVVVLYSNVYRRHLAEEGISPDDNLLEYLEMVQDGAIHGLLQELEDEEKSLGRNLQGSELLETLTVTFIRCIFEGNKASAGGDAFGGIISASYDDIILIFEECVFRNNDYGDATVKPSTYAILSWGPLTIENSCFDNNLFVREAPVITYGETPVTLSNNYVTPTDVELACPFVATFANETSRLRLSNFSCALPDAETCPTVPLLTSAPSPAPTSVEKTRSPVAKVTLAPEEVEEDAATWHGVPLAVAALLGLTGVLIAT